MADVKIDGRYRHTVLREHVITEMGWSQSWLQSLQHVQILPELRNRIGAQHDEILRRTLTLENFFYVPPPECDAPVFLPSEVILSEQNPKPVYSDLTALIETLDRDHEPHSVLLIARSGAGKTVAARKAFCDCVVAPPGRDHPILADYLPCWIHFDGIGTRDPEGRVYPDLIERLILRACGLNAEDARQTQMTVPGLRCWLNHPRLKLLLFLDLNAWNLTAREDIANDLCRFLATYNTIGHRAVVTYRSSPAEQTPLHVLRVNRQFKQYDLKAVSLDRVRRYIRDIKKFEKALGAPIANPLPRLADVEARLINQLTDLFTDAGESILSTPVFLHYASIMDPRGKTLSDLYEHVLKWYLNRDRSFCATCGQLDADSGKTNAIRIRDLLERPGKIEEAMTMIAVFLAERPDVKSIDRVDFFEELTAKQPQFTEEAAQMLQEFSLMQMDDTPQRLRFLHDSLIYFFSARSLYGRARDLPSSRWAQFAVSKLQAWNRIADKVAEFLGGMLDENALADLLSEVKRFSSFESSSRMEQYLRRGASGRQN